jgi:uncharacterized protein YggE
VILPLTTAIVLSLATAWPAAAQEPVPPQVPTIVTVGEAVVRRAPDRAFVTVNVETRDKNPRDAQKQNAEAMTAVQQRLAQVRVPKDAIRTTGYDLEQQVDFVEGRRVPRDFVARNGIEVRVDDTTRVGDILDAAVRSGATSVSGIRFDLQDRDGAEREALRLAVADARARADAAASGAGRTVDRILRIEDTREGVVPPPRPMMAMAKTADAAQTPVEPGLMEFRARVTLSVSMK